MYVFQGAHSEFWWVAGSDKLKEGTFQWCYSNKTKKMKTPPPIPFADGSPDSKMGNEDCLALQKIGHDFKLDDKRCNEERGAFICEARHFFFNLSS